MSKAHTLVDNFNDNALDGTKWAAFADTTPSDRIHEVNGRLELRPASGTSSYGGILSNAVYDLSGSEIRVEVVRTLNAASNAVTYLTAQASNNVDHIYIRTEGSSLICSWLIGSYTVLASTPYDPVAHRWWRLRELGGTLYWETSPDCARWEVQASHPTPAGYTATRTGLGMIASTVASPGVAIFDNFNVQGTSLSRRVEERRLSARGVRVQAAELAAERRHDEHVNNNDEVNYPERRFVGNYSKSLKHDSVGDPDPGSYATMLRALQ